MTNHGKRIAVLYATSDGQTRKIAEYVATRLRERRVSVEIDDVEHLPVGFSVADADGAILAAPIHVGKHDKAMVKFVKRHRTELESIPTAFLSVSLSEAGVERPDTPADRRAASRADVARMVDEFVRETGWRAGMTRPVAGALRYSHYGFLIRFVMRSISKKMGGDVDPSHDYEYTDWESLGHFVDDFADQLGPGGSASRSDRPEHGQRT